MLVYTTFLNLILRSEKLMGAFIIIEIVQNKSSLLLKIIFKTTQTLQIFMINIKTDFIYKKL